MIEFMVRKKLFTYDSDSGKLYRNDHFMFNISFSNDAQRLFFTYDFSYMSEVKIEKILVGLFNQFGISSKIIKKTIMEGGWNEQYRFTIIFKSPEDKAKFLIYFGNYIG